MIYAEIYKHNGIAGTYSRIDVIESFNSLNWFISKNYYGGSALTINPLDNKATIANFLSGSNVLVIKENDTILHAGFMLPREVNTVALARTVDVVGRLKHFYTEQERLYTAEDAGAIAWDLIDMAQNRTGGDLNISQASIATTVNRDRTYRNKSVGEAIIDLSNVIDGFDFEITPTSSNGLLTGFSFTVAQEFGTLRNDLPTLVEGQNITKLTSSVQGQVFNSLRGLGEGFGDLVPEFSQDNASSIEGYSRYEKINKYADVSVESSLEEAVNRDLNNTINEELHIEFEIMPNSNLDPDLIRLGDTIKIDTQSDVQLNNIKGFCKVIELAYFVDEQGVKKCIPKVLYYR